MNWFNYRSIKAEIALGFVGLLLFSVVLAGVGWNSLDRFAKGVSQSEILNSWANTLIRLRRYEREYKIYLNPDQLILMRTEISNLQAKINNDRKSFIEEDDTAFLDGIFSVTNKYQSSFDNYVEQQQSMSHVLQQLKGVMDGIESDTRLFATNNGLHSHFLKQQMEERWELFLSDQDEAELLESYRRSAAELERQNLGKAETQNVPQSSNVEISAYLAGIAESLLQSSVNHGTPDVYQQLLNHSRRIQGLIQKTKGARRNELDESYAALRVMLKKRQDQLERQAFIHRLQYDVAQGQFSRATIMTEAAKQLQIWTGRLQQQEKEYLLDSTPANVDLVRERIHQIILAAEDMLSGMIDDENKTRLLVVVGQIKKYTEGFERLQQSVSERIRADQAMGNAIAELQAISRNAAIQRQSKLNSWHTEASRQMLIGSIVTFTAAVILALIIGRRLSGSISAITSAITRVAKGEHDVETPGLQRKDEIGKMAAAVEVFKQTLVKAIDLQQQQAEENLARRRAEAEVRALNADLESRVLQRTNQLQQTNIELEKTLETLTQAQQQLVESEKMAALSGLVSGVAHELNTPLGNSITAISHMKDQLLDVSQAFKRGELSRTHMEEYFASGDEVFELATDNLNRAAKLIKAFKTLAMDADESKPEDYDLGRIVEDSFFSLNHLTEQAGLRVEYECAADIILRGFPSDLFQIISHLVNNSITHAYTRGDHGVLRFQGQLTDGGVCLRYSDDGRGMSEEQQEKVFEPFYTTSRGQGGTGLGMHMVYNLISQRLKGNIHCYSVPSEGTEFVINIPMPGMNS
ncbi:MAG: ATP-binding protein [Motiliproteus sp.]